MTLDQFYSRYKNQALIYEPNIKTQPGLRGECVQLVMKYVTEVWGRPVIWQHAYGWYGSGLLSDKYSRVAFTGKNRPPRGAVIVWKTSLPGSGGYGHIGVVWKAPAGSNTFISLDQNWGGRYVHLVTHDWKHVAGWLVPKKSATKKPKPKPQPKPSKGGNEMIANSDQATKMYKLLRPNGTPSKAEIKNTVGRRSFAGFLNDAQKEVQNRDSNLRKQKEQFKALQNTINALNKTITEMRAAETAEDAVEAQKTAKIAELTAQLEGNFDLLKDSQTELEKLQGLPTESVPAQPDAPAENKPGLLVRILAALMRKKG